MLGSPSPDYYPSYSVANMLRMTGLAVSKITSSLMVVLSDGTKVNVGLSLKFQGKGLKVLNYTRMEDRGWEYSAQAVELLREYKAAFPQLFSKLDNRGDGKLILVRTVKQGLMSLKRWSNRPICSLGQTQTRKLRR